MKHTDWRRRITQRSDMAARITHLTRGADDDEAFEKLWKILLEQKLNGSDNSGFIIGKRKAVCLQELPLGAIAENLLYEKSLDDKIRYSPFGIRFHKGFIYNKGGRPVIYEDSEVMKTILPEGEFWRIVNLNLANSEAYVDWTHEREWRVPDNLEFTYTNIEVIVKSSKYYRKLVNRCIDENRLDILQEIHGIITLNSIYS